MTRDPVLTDDCNAGHREAKSSELAFRLRTKPIGTMPDGHGGTLELGTCIHCDSTIAIQGVSNA